MKRYTHRNFLGIKPSNFLWDSFRSKESWDLSPKAILFRMREAPMLPPRNRISHCFTNKSKQINRYKVMMNSYYKQLIYKQEKLRRTELGTEDAVRLRRPELHNNAPKKVMTPQEPLLPRPHGSRVFTWSPNMERVATTTPSRGSRHLHVTSRKSLISGARKRDSVAHARPQKLRHKNRVYVAHWTMRHRIKVFCGAYGSSAPQK
jgi:hypothetical protein